MKPRHRFLKIELLILKLLKTKDCCDEDIFTYIQSFETIPIGEILTALFFMQETHLIASDSQERYYHIQEAGYVRYETLKREYQQSMKIVKEMFHDENI